MSRERGKQKVRTLTDTDSNKMGYRDDTQKSPDHSARNRRLINLIFWPFTLALYNIKIVGVFVFPFLVLFYGSIVSAVLFVKFLKNPKLFFKRDQHPPPPCLADPRYGSHHFMKMSEGVKIHYVSAGNLDHPLMLFVHGFPEFWYSWRYQIETFKKQYRVVAMDMRGYGDSDVLGKVSDYDATAVTRDVFDLVHGLGYKSCVLVGHDWGGIIAWRVAMKYPELVSKLIVLNAPHLGCFQSYLSGHFTQFLKSWYVMLFQLPVVPELFISNCDYEAITTIFKKTNFLKKTEYSDEGYENCKITDTDIAAFKYNASRPGRLTAMINYYRCIMRTKSVKEFPPIQCPTLLIWGQEDTALEEDMIPYIEKIVDDLTVVRISGASHWVQQEEPKLCDNAIHKFLN